MMIGEGGGESLLERHNCFKKRSFVKPSLDKFKFGIDIRKMHFSEVLRESLDIQSSNKPNSFNILQQIENSN